MVPKDLVLHRVKVHDLTPDQVCSYDFLIGWERLAITQLKNGNDYFYNSKDIKRFENAGFTVVPQKETTHEITEYVNKMLKDLNEN